MKLPLLSCIVIFVLWLVGIVCIFYVITHSEDSAVESSKWLSLMRTLTKESEQYLRGAATLLPQHLPQHPLWGAEDAEKRMHIYFIWLGSDSSFNIYNYLSLESALAVYPRAMFTCLVFSPSGEDFQSHKVPGALPANIFQKYRKLGYNIRVVPLFGVRKTEGLQPTTQQLYSQLGARPDAKYLQSWVYRREPGCSNCTAPYHLSLFYAFQSLFRTGGLLLDFSFYFLNNLEALKNSYYLNSYCLSPAETKPSRVYRPKTFENTSPSHLDCTTSTFFLARERQSPIVRCVLESYLLDDLFSVCVDSDNHFGGAQCVEKRWRECTESVLSGKPTITTSSNSNSGNKENARTTSTASSGAIREEDGETRSLVEDASSLPSSSTDKENDNLPSSPLVAEQQRRTLSSATASASASSQPSDSYTSFSASSHTIEGVLEVFDNHPLTVKYYLLQAHNWTLRESSCLLFLGQLAFSPSSSAALALSPSTWLPKHSLLYSAVEQTRAIRNADPGLLSRWPRTALSPNESHNDSLSSARRSSPAKDEASQTCWGFASKIALPSHLPFHSSSAGIAHPMPTTQAAAILSLPSFGCSPSIFIAGFPHSGASAFFSSLSRHPLVLVPQCGDYRGSEAYVSTQGIRSRTLCYPFIEPGERFVSIDGNVYHDLNPFVPYTIQQDNPEARVVFVLRHPVERLYLHYLRTMPAEGLSFDEMIMPLIAEPTSPISMLRSLVMDHAPVARLLDAFYLPDPLPSHGNHSLASLRNRTHVKQVEDMLRHSLYALPILHYAQVLGEQRIVILPAEPVLSQSAEGWNLLDAALERMGLITLRNFHDKIRPTLQWAMEEDRRLIEGVGASPRRMSLDMYCKLQTFFQPFHQLLENFTSWRQWQNASSWERCPLHESIYSASNAVQEELWRGLPLYSEHNQNESWPKLWFEQSPSTSTSIALPKRLVPQRESSEDSGFNTTLGMLNTF